jgi:hypothetical protein
VSPSPIKRTEEGAACAGMHQAHKSGARGAFLPLWESSTSPRRVLAVATAVAFAWTAVFVTVKAGVTVLHRGHCLSAGLKRRPRLRQRRPEVSIGTPSTTLEKAADFIGGVIRISGS